MQSALEPRYRTIAGGERVEKDRLGDIGVVTLQRTMAGVLVVISVCLSLRMRQRCLRRRVRSLCARRTGSGLTTAAVEPSCCYMYSFFAATGRRDLCCRRSFVHCCSARQCCTAGGRGE